MAAGQAPPPTRVEVLGPLRLVVDGVAVDVRGPEAARGARAAGARRGPDRDGRSPGGRAVAAEVPESGRQALHSHVSRLRGHLGPAAARLQTVHDGYRLDLGDRRTGPGAGPGAAGARARRCAATTRPTRTPCCGRRTRCGAGRCWPTSPTSRRSRAAVEECAQLHREVTDALIASRDRRRSRRTGSWASPRRRVAADPLREPAVLLLMRALAATGQAPEALRAGRGVPAPAGRGDRPRPVTGAGRARARHRRRSRRSGTRLRRTRPARPTTRLIGREAQVAALHRLLAVERLVTVVGPGGVGKTRVALEVARRTDAATVLLLAPVTDPAAIPHALAAALNLTVVHGDVLAACVAVLGDRPGLLVDRQLRAPARRGPRHRRRGAVRAARDCRCWPPAANRSGWPPSTPSGWRRCRCPAAAATEDLPQVPSVAVFLDRAGRVRPGPPPTPAELHTVADIVRRLDGMPLAIELAAGRLSTFSLDRPAPPARPLARPARRRPAQRRPPAPDAARDRRVVLPVAHGRRTPAVPAPVGLRRRRRPRHRRAARHRPGPGRAIRAAVLARLVDASMIDAHFADGHPVPHAGDAAGVRPRPAGRGRRGRSRSRAPGALGGRADRRGSPPIMTTEREPEADAALRRELPNLRAAWRLARRRVPLDDAAIDRHRTVRRGRLPRPRRDSRLGRGTGRGPGARRPPARGRGARHRGGSRLPPRRPPAGRTARPRRARSGRPTMPTSWYCLLPLSVAALARGAYAEAVDHSLAAPPRSPVGRATASGSPPWRRRTRATRTRHGR